MYTACLFCSADLGRNEALEAFPIGRRLAFDPEKGRLWVVCLACARWNLTPLDERWEANEAAERAFRATRVRVSTDQVGLARLPEGLELVRIGRPLRPEFAAWRYGDQFGRRRRDHLLSGGISAAALGVAGLAAAGLVAPLLVVPAAIASIGSLALVNRQGPMFSSWVTLATNDGTRLRLAPWQLGDTEMRLDEGGAMKVALQYMEQEEARPDFTLQQRNYVTRFAEFRGAEALRAARLLLPRVNRDGGGAAAVRDAVQEIDRIGTPDGYVTHTLDALRRRGLGYSPLAAYPQVMRLGLEMAVHEDAERRAMDGELAALEAEWRAAEAIAAIADSLLVSPEVERRLAALRKAKGRPGA